MLLTLMIKNHKAIWLECVAVKYVKQDEELMT